MTNEILDITPPVTFLPKQLHTMKMIEEKTFIVYSGAVGAGKTLLLAHAAIKTCLNNPNTKGIIGSLTYTQLTNVVWTVFNEELDKYQELLDSNGIPIKLIKDHSRSMGKMYIEFYNGSIIYFLAMGKDQEEKIRGYTIDFVCLDEPIEIDVVIFHQLIARMRGKHLKNRFMLLTTNPSAKTHWIYQKFYQTTNPSYYHIDTNSYENFFLDISYIRELENAYDSDWIRRFLNGEWGAFSGQVYKAFSPSTHVINAENYKDQIKYYIAGVDWGSTNPSCILTLGILADKTAIVVDEYYKSEVISTQVAREIQSRDRKYNYKKVFIDPSAHDLIAQCEELHIPVEKADNHVEAGIGKVKSLIERNQILIDGTCINLIKELQSYSYEKDRTGQNKTEKPVKKFDHACDALRYGIYSFKLYKRKSGWLTLANPMEVNEEY